MEARVTAYSQSNRLRERMIEADVRHGQELRADVRGVRVQVTSPAWLSRRVQVRADAYFCGVSAVRVRRVVVEGDGGVLPEETILDGMRVPAEGTYDLLNVLVRSNGDLRLIVDEVSRVEPATARGAGYIAGS
jgi:hypothetical protein